MGTPEFSIPTLQLLNLKHKIKSVYTQPPKKKSRGQKIIKSPIIFDLRNIYNKDELTNLDFKYYGIGK